jgi:hypothetical protein
VVFLKKYLPLVLVSRAIFLLERAEMRLHRVILSACLLGLQTLAAASDARPSTVPFSTALEGALNDPGVPFSLKVNCIDDTGNRQFRLLGNAVGIWNNAIQVTVDDATRREMIDALMRSGFADFETHYGGKAGSGRIKAPIIVMCAVEAQVGGTEKASYQDVNGERSKALLDLANGLLDRVEPLAKDGIGAESLAEGLEKVSGGSLAPETLYVRMLHLPADADRPGIIMKIEDGMLAFQKYHPGVLVEDWRAARLTPAQLNQALEAIEGSNFEELPEQLPSSDSWQLEVAVLDQRHNVTARNVSSPAVRSRVAETKVLEALARDLLALQPPAEP